MTGSGGAALERLDEITRRLRRECPWDREQDERSIVPHTVEEAYELADAARSGDDAKLLDELGDVLFQVFFLSLLLEERGAGDLGAVAEGTIAKLVRRHPHIFGDVEVGGAEDVRRNWDRIKRAEVGREQRLFGDIPELLPAPLYAAKVLRRAHAATADALPRAAEAIDDSAGEGERFEAAGDIMLAAVATARGVGVDPELALRAAADRLKARIEQEVESPGE